MGGSLKGWLSSLTSRRLAYIREYEAARSQAAADAVTAKYSYLFHDQRPVPKIELDFSPDGNLTVTADGKPLQRG